MKKITKLILAVTIMAAAAMPSPAQTIIVNNQTANGKNAGFKPNIDLTKFEKHLFKSGKEIYTSKQNIYSKNLNAEETELVTVTFKLNYDHGSMFTDGAITVTGENFSGDLWMDYDEENDSYTQQLPVGTYDFLTAAFLFGYGIAYNVKELVDINNDTTITFNFSESNIRYDYKTFKPNGEEAILSEFPSDEYSKFVPGNTTYFVDNITLILKGFGNVGVYESTAYGSEHNKNPYWAVFTNSLSNRYKLVSERAFEDENGLYIVKYETSDMKNTLLQNNPENFVLYEEEFNSIGNDNNNLFQGFSTIEMIDNVKIGGIYRDVSFPITDPTVRIYVDPNRKDDTEPNKYDILIQPKFQDNVSVDVPYTWYDYDDEDNPIENTETIQVYRTIIGLPVLIDNDGSIEYVNAGHDAAGNYAFHIPEGGSDIMQYPGHPQFSFVSRKKALPLGSNCPITSLLAQNTEGLYTKGKYPYLEPAFIGRYGEVVSGYYTVEIKYNGNTICNNYLTMPEDLYNFAAESPSNGEMTAHFENTNAVVDGLQSKNVTDTYFDQRQEDWTAPTLQMLQFKDAEGNITDRFDNAEDGILEFAGGDFNYTVDMNTSASWFNCKEQTVEVSYAPYNSGKWETLDVTEVPDNFYMPGFGYFYRAPLQAVADQGWFDLKIKLTDQSGNWQEQTVSPAFRIGNAPSGITGVKTGTATEVARYTVDGRSINTPQAGVNIVKMSDGSVKKVWVK